jgi:dolichol-phosphate mannosyltransferase
MMPSKRVLICVPTYNERDNVEALSHAIFENTSPAVEILFVDDGSPDGTGEILKLMTMKDPRVHVIHRKGKLGLASAYLQAFQWGLARGYDWIAEMDADFSHDPQHLKLVEQEIEEGSSDVLCGSRYIPGGGVSNWSKGRVLLSKLGSVYSRWILGFPMADWTGGFNFWSRHALDSLQLESVKSKGYAFQIEMKYRALTKKFRVKEFPIVFRERRAGVSKMSGSIVREALLGVLRLRFAQQTGKLFN